MNIKVINNEFSRGKGAAIRCGLEYCKSKGSDYVLIADSDGQHDYNDVLNILKIGLEKNKFIIGSRNFDDKVPFRNRIGNKLASYLLYIITNIKIRDTQCGLRYIPSKFFKILISLQLNNFDFEMYTLFKIMTFQKIEIVDIKTIYSKENYTTNFRVFFDSIKILFIFFKIFIKIKKENKIIHK